MNNSDDLVPEMGDNSSPAPRGLWSTLWPALFAGLASVAGVLPIMSLGPFAILMREDLGLDDSAIGLVFATFFIGALIGTSAGAWVLRRFGGERTVAIGALLAAIGCGATGTAGSTTALFVIAALAGIANGLVQPGINVFIMKRVRENLRGFAFGLRVAGVPAASGFSSICAIAVDHLSLNWHWYFAVCALGSLALSATVLFRPTASTTAVQKERSREASRPGPVILMLSASGLLAATATSILAPFLVGALVGKGAPFGLAALVVSIAGGLGVISRVGIGLIADRLGNARTHLGLSAVMLLICALGMSSIGLLPGIPAAIASAVLSYGIGWAWPGLIHFAALTLNPGSQNATATLMQLGTFGGAIIGPAAFGFIAAGQGQSLAWIVFGGMSLVAAAGIMAATLVSRRGGRRR